MNRFYRTFVWSLAVFGTATLAQAQLQQRSGAAQTRQGAAQQQPAQAKAQQQPVAIVNDEPITRSEYRSALEAQLKQVDQSDPQAIQQLRQQVLSSLVDSRLVEQHLREEGPNVADQEVQAVVDQYKQQFEAQGVPFEQFLASTGYSKSDLEKRIEGSLAWKKYHEQQATDQKLQQHFAENQERFPAQEFEQAKPLVAQSYAGQLWTEILEEVRPKAEIEVVQPAQPQTPRTAPGNPAAPQQR